MKKDAARIKRHLAALRYAAWLGPARRWWPQYIFHFTDISNALRVLETGKLICRSQADIATDIASSEVIGHTEEEWKRYVRLYFRPRTPTQYHNEGFRPRTCLGQLQAHCPMPVFFLFDAGTLLTLDTTRFSDGNLASPGVRVGDDATFLESIPFDKVYHDSRLSDTEKRKVIYHRHAEVLVPGALDLSALKWVVCRTEAELRTLHHLLPSSLQRKAFLNKTRTVQQLFHLRWTFVESAKLEQQQVTARFNRSSATPGPFVARLEIEDLERGKKYYWEDRNYFAKEILQVRIPQLVTPTSYRARLTLDGALAYADTFLPDASIF